MAVGSTNAAPGAVVSLPFSFTNTNQIVGMQFDLVFPTALVEAGSAAAGSGGVTAESRELAAGQRRVVVFSPTNALLPNEVVVSLPLTLKPGSPAGGPTVTVKNIILTNRQGQTFSPTLNYKALDAWRQLHFTEAERGDPELIGDGKDPDADGLSNLVEFLLGSNPRASEPARAPRAVPVTGGNQGIAVSFRTAKNVTAAQLSIEGSPDLATWNGNGITVSPTGQEDATSLEYQATFTAAAGEQRHFLRLVGTRTAGN